MKLIIAGSREITELSAVTDALEASGFTPTEIVSGGARGVDRLGEVLAAQLGIKITIFYADWETYNRGAGFKRNETMADYSDALLAVWDGESRGTKHMIDTMTKKGKPVYVHRPVV